MKRPIAILLLGLLTLSLAGCGSKPSEKEIKKALENGIITVEDAMSKGWIDQEWIEDNFEPIEAKTKIHLFDPFETTYLDGTEAPQNIIQGRMCLVFFNTQGEKTMKELEIFNDAYEQMQEKGVPVLGIITDEDLESAKVKLKDIEFPIIVYNDSMKKSLEQYDEIINSDITSVFTKDGGIYTAWSNSSTVEGLVKYAEELANEE